MSSGVAEPFNGFTSTLPDTATAQAAQPRLKLGLDKPLRSGHPKPSGRFGLIDFYPVTVGIVPSDLILSPSETLVGSLAVPFGRLRDIPGDTRATGIKQPQFQLGFGVPCLCARFSSLKRPALGFGLLPGKLKRGAEPQEQQRRYHPVYLHALRVVV